MRSGWYVSRWHNDTWFFSGIPFFFFFFLQFSHVFACSLKNESFFFQTPSSLDISLLLSLRTFLRVNFPFFFSNNKSCFLLSVWTSYISVPLWWAGMCCKQKPTLNCVLKKVIWNSKLGSDANAECQYLTSWDSTMNCFNIVALRLFSAHMGTFLKLFWKGQYHQIWGYMVSNGRQQYVELLSNYWRKLSAFFGEVCLLYIVVFNLSIGVTCMIMREDNLVNTSTCMLIKLKLLWVVLVS